jgi:hypothetical protein
MNLDVISGNEPERADFRRRNGPFLEELQQLKALVRTIFQRTHSLESPAAKIVFFQGNAAAETFAELLYLAGNAAGHGSMVLLRSLYERTVLCAYLAAHPDKAKDYVLFGDILQGKALTHAQNSGWPVAPSDEENAEIRARQSAAQAYLGNRSHWSTLDLFSMAQQAPCAIGDKSLSTLYLPCYWEPTQDAHGTVHALVRRVSGTPGDVRFEAGPSRSLADWAVQFGHLLLLGVFSTQNDLFQLGLAEELRRRDEAASRIWRRES